MAHIPPKMLLKESTVVLHASATTNPQPVIRRYLSICHFLFLLLPYLPMDRYDDFPPIPAWLYSATKPLKQIRGPSGTIQWGIKYIGLFWGLHFTEASGGVQCFGTPSPDLNP